MALLGPMVVVAENSAADLIDVLRKAGAFPIAETRWADAPAAIAEIQPVALAIADPQGAPSPQHVDAVIECIETRAGPVTPVIALVESNCSPAIPSALPIALDDSTDRLIARLRSALRIRTLHATVLRRSRTAGAKKRAPAFVPPDLLDDATVLCVGRGGSYSALSVAIGERVGLIGALSIETAARYLNARAFAICRSACWTMPRSTTNVCPTWCASKPIRRNSSSESFHSCACKRSRVSSHAF